MMHNWDFAMKMLVSSICNFNALFYPLNSVKNNQIWHSHSDSIDQEMKWCKTAKHVYQNSKNQCTVTKSIWPHTHGLFVYISSDDELHQKLFWKILQPIKASFCIFLSCIITQLPWWGHRVPLTYSGWCWCYCSEFYVASPPKCPMLSHERTYGWSTWLTFRCSCSTVLLLENQF